ncbi:MAG: family 10 glycosylhydrolase [Clostridia bacterium]|nr:family 10 glycosylhydrolase [Clostridia bacterium]
MRRLFSFMLALLMCWSLVYAIFPVAEASAVVTGTAALDGERYTVDWTIPDIGTDSMVSGNAPVYTEAKIDGLTYEILGYVSPKYPDSHATDKDEVDGGFELLDGTVASNHFLNDPWVGIYGNETNGILIDLGASYSNLCSVGLHMLSDPELGIFLPSKITIASSMDGVTYNKVGEMNYLKGNIESGYYVPTEYGSVTYDVHHTAANLFKGQYILLTFEHEQGSDGFDRCWTFISELAVTTSGDAVMNDFTGVGDMETYPKPTGDVYNVNVALNSDYQIIGSVSSGIWGDTNRAELTDGVDKGGDINLDTDYVVIKPTNGVLNIQLDLGAVTENITDIAVSGYGGGSGAYSMPTSVELYGSLDGKTYYKVGMTASSPAVSGNVYELGYSVNSSKAFTARYLTLVVNSASDTAVDEVIVTTTNASVERLNIATEGTYKYLLNTASSLFNDDKWAGDTVSSIPALNTYAKGDLNDGISATGTFIDPAWVGYSYAATAENSPYVDIVFDLGTEKKSINTVSFKLLEYTNSSTTSFSSVPDSFTVFYANEAELFGTGASSIGGKADTLVVNSSTSNRQLYHSYSATLNSVTARYIMVRIPKAKRELLIDEIQIITGNLDPVVADKAPHTPINYDTMSGVWLDCFNISDLYLVQGAYQADEQTYRTRLSNYLTALNDSGINTVMLHARSHGDALYGDYTFDSVSPTSWRYTGSLTAVSTYDAFEIFIEEAHKIGISVHAWVNPLRIGYATDLNTYDDSYAVKQLYNGNYGGVEHSDYVGMSNDNLYWLNIGYESVRFHIIDTVMEIVNNYDVDGIVMDDYFYPVGATTAFDSECFSEYTGTLGLGAWRRENTDHLVRGLYKRIKQAKPDVLFGISPDEDITNYETSYNYSVMYADVKKWCTQTWSDGDNTYLYADYMSPQFYGATEAEFMGVSRRTYYNYEISGMLSEWLKLSVPEGGTKIIASLGLYKNFSDNVASEYEVNNVILDQLQLMRRYVLDSEYREKNPVDEDGYGVNLVYGAIMYSSHSLYNDFSTPEGWATNSVLNSSRHAAIRNELKQYWQGTLTPVTE